MALQIYPSGGIFQSPTLGPDGSNTAPTYSFSSNPTFGWYQSSTNRMGLAQNSAERFAIDLNSRAVVMQPSNGIYGWTGFSFTDGQQPDTGLSRNGSAYIIVGNGTQGDQSGIFGAAQYRVGSFVTLDNSGGVLRIAFDPSWTGISLLKPITLGGTVMSNVPVLTWAPYVTGAVGTTGGASNWGVFIPASGLTITRITVTFTSNTLAGYSTAPQIRLTDGTTPILINLTSVGFVDSGVLSQNYAAGATLHVDTVNGVGGTGSASGMVVTVQYRMQ